MRTYGLSGGWGFALALFGALMGAAMPARACPATCQTLRTFGQGVAVPGNLVYFKVLVDDPGVLSLKTADGTAIAASIRMIGQDRVYAPIDPIPADTMVVLSYVENTCGRNAMPMTYAFQTRAPLQLQLQDAIITSGEYGVIGGFGETFSPPVTSLAFQRISYGSPDAAGAVVHLIDIDVNVDGRQFWVPYPNNYDMGPIEIRGVCSAIGPIPRVVGTCGAPIYGPGRHTVSVQPHIVGYADPPPSSLDIDFDMACGVSGATPADAGARMSPPAPADAGVTMQLADASPSSKAGSACTVALAQGDAAIQSQSIPQASGGCSATHQRAGGGVWPWLVMLALTCLGRRRVRG
jgi:uncharacterized protein (TIGR03382 family)